MFANMHCCLSSVGRYGATALLISTLAACGGSSSSGGTGEALLVDEDLVEIDTPLLTTPSGDDHDGEYILIVQPAQTILNGFIDCSVDPGRVTVYEGDLRGFVDQVLTIEGTVTPEGVLNGSALSAGSVIATFEGRLNGDGGTGTYSQSIGCSGSWRLERTTYDALADDEIFVIAPGEFPASLLVRFIPTQAVDEQGVQCPSATGIVETNGRIGSIDKEIDYRGYAVTNLGFRWDVDFSIDTDSGEVNGSYRYDPLDAQGSLNGDAFFAMTDRPYEADRFASDLGCAGVWQMTVAGVEFPSLPSLDLPSEPIATVEDVTPTSGSIEDAVPTVESAPESIYMTPFCTDAAAAIRSTVELGMTPDEIYRIVGKPVEVTSSGTRWLYGWYFNAPKVEFSTRTVGGVSELNVVDGFESDAVGCDDADNAFVDAANSLAIEGNSLDNTDLIPTCMDAALRLQAFVRVGMKPEDVRRIVGRPLAVSSSGTRWEYSANFSGPIAEFSRIWVDNAFELHLVDGYSTDIGRC